MKNKFLTPFLILLFCFGIVKQVLSNEFIFEVTDLDIIDNGNIYKGNNRGKIITDNQLELISNNFEYLKKINRLEANGDVQLFDFKSDIIINAEKIFYLKNEEKVFTLGKTLIQVSDKYTIQGHDITFLKDKMFLSSKKNTVITDNELNIYSLEQFQYSIDKEILKGENIVMTTNNKKNKSDEFFFQTGFFNLKENKFLAKDVTSKFHKNLFGNTENDPRINAVSGYGNKFNTYFEKGVFTTCKKTDKCPPWKIISNKIHHDKIKKQVIYKNAWLHLYDFPVVYFPRFFHPDPTVKRQSGFLNPELGSTNNLGSSLYMPYFLAISDDKDLTIKPRLFDNNKFLLQSEYRQLTKNSLTIADFSFLRGHNSSSQDKGGTRSHLFTDTTMNLSLDNYKSSVLKINYQKTSNDTYLKLFDLESPLLLEDNSILESVIKIDLEHENYDLITSVEMYENLNTSNDNRYQYVLPNYGFTKNFSLKNITGGFNFGSNGSNSLTNSNTVISSISNDLKYSTLDTFFDNGIKTNFNVLLKNTNSVAKNSSEYENSLQSDLISNYIYNASFPLTKKNPKSFNTLEPKLSLRFNPHEMNDNSNSYSRIDTSNVFSTDRLGFEEGESITVGLNFKKEKVNIVNEIDVIEEYFDFKIASVLRLNEEKKISKSSTLDKKISNIFGELNFKPIRNISLDYNFSLTEDLDRFEYNSLIAKMEFNNFMTQFNYLEEKGFIGSTNVIGNKSKYTFNNENSISFNTRKNRKLNLTEYYDLLYEYKNDCLVASVQYKKNYYNDADIKPIEELFFSITIVPLGTFSPDKMALK
jgi:LPS-assembly protein